MNTIERTAEFNKWLSKLSDQIGKSAIMSRVDSVILGNYGDSKSVGGGVSELRINSGPGYRVYYTIRGKTVVFLLCGGTKNSQQADIAKAKALAKGI